MAYRHRSGGLDFLYGHAAGVESLAFHPSGEILASGSRDDTIRIWDVASGRTQIYIPEHEGDVLSVDFNFDGSLLASGSQDRTIRLWDPATGDPIRTLPGHESGVRTLTFSPDGRTIASGSWDSTVRVWNVATGELMSTFVGHTSSVRSVAFSPDGSTIASGGRDGTVLIWDAPLLPPEISEELPPVAADIDGDGMVDIADLVRVASAFGDTGENLAADVNADGVVDIADLVAVAGAFGNEIAAAPEPPDTAALLSEGEVRQWLEQARLLRLTDPVSQRGILILEQLLTAFRPTETALLPNYPNPFNPETWIPFHLAEDADVQFTIYDADGTVRKANGFRVSVSRLLHRSESCGILEWQKPARRGSRKRCIFLYAVYGGICGNEKNVDTEIAFWTCRRLHAKMRNTPYHLWRI